MKDKIGPYYKNIVNEVIYKYEEVKFETTEMILILSVMIKNAEVRVLKTSIKRNFLFQKFMI